jgi:large subunit ribosomal protein L18
MSKKKQAIGLRRKREHKTNYYRRLKLLKSRKVRLVVRIYSRSVLGQLVEYKAGGDNVLVSFNSTRLKDFGWEHNCGNIPAVYLAGYALAKRGLAKGIKEGIMDIGFHPAIVGSKPFAFAKGVIDGGLDVPVSETMFPAEERLKGNHISEYQKIAKAGSQFSKSKKGITEDFEKVKAKIK